VKLETLDALGRRLGGELAAGGVGEWRDALERERQAAIEAARDGEKTSLKEAIETIEAGRERIRDWPLSTDSWALVDAGLTRAYRLGRRAMRRTAADPSAENVHEWRKRAKDLRYQLRLLCNAWPGLLEATEEQSHELSDLLGEHHDLAILCEDLAGRELGAADRKGLEGAIADSQGELAGRAVDLGRRLYAERPKPFRRRIRAYWRAWRRPGSSPISS
jgi:CHAD domain-containing protein